MHRFITMTCAALLLSPAALDGQTSQNGNLPDITGTWQVDTPDGPQEIVVRPDSAAVFNQEIVRWRLMGDTLFIAFGEEWVGYYYRLRGRSLRLWGGDLEEPYELRRTGAPKPLPEGMEVPPAPPMTPETVIPPDG